MLRSEPGQFPLNPRDGFEQSATRRSPTSGRHDAYTHERELYFQVVSETAARDWLPVASQGVFMSRLAYVVLIAWISCSQGNSPELDFYAYEKSVFRHFA